MLELISYLHTWPKVRIWFRAAYRRQNTPSAVFRFAQNSCGYSSSCCAALAQIPFSEASQEKDIK